MRAIDSITVKDIVGILEDYKHKSQLRMAQIVRKVLSDVFKEAQQAGEVLAGFNPADATKKPQVRVSRQRLTFEEWLMIYQAAEKDNYFLQKGMLLAIIKGMRLADICNIKFSDIRDGHLFVEQSKTGAKIAIPVKLRCNKLNISLEDVIAQCRDRILSPYLLHHHHDKGKGKRGGMVKPASLTGAFRKARDSVDYDWSSKGAPPSFHEQRSLAEKIFREQGINTQILLGHNSKVMTDHYNDTRGKEWKKLVN